MPGPQLFSDNAITTLAGSITNTATTMVVQPGAGALFPSPGPGQFFLCTLNDAATGEVYEIVKVTTRSVDTFTIVRAQEGTAAQNWLAGDTVFMAVTAGTLAGFDQHTKLGANTTYYCDWDAGSDSTGDGSVGNPWKSLQHAWTYLFNNIDGSGYVVTILQQNDGVDTTGVLINGQILGASTVELTINGGISVTNGNGIEVFGGSAVIEVDGTGEISASGSSAGIGYGIIAFNNAYVSYQGITFGACGNAHTLARSGGRLQPQGSFTIAGNSPAHWAISDVSGLFVFNTPTITFSGSPTITNFAHVSGNSVVNCAAALFSGTMSGAQYLVDTGGGIVGGSALSTISGATAGAINAPGWVV